MSRAKTKEEVRNEFINEIKDMGQYWLEIQKENGYDTKRTLEGFLFSIYGLFDGVNVGVPAFDIVIAKRNGEKKGFNIVVRPHPDDKQYHQKNDEDYYEDGMCINDDIYLHEIKGSTNL